MDDLSPTVNGPSRRPFPGTLVSSVCLEMRPAVYRWGFDFAPSSRPPLHGRLIFALIEGGYWKEAMAECLRAFEAAPDDQSLPRGAGWSLMGHGRYEEAIVCLQKAAENADANNIVTAHYSLALLYQQMGRHEDAIKVFRRTTQLTPVYAPSYEGLGVELAATGHREEAITAFQHAIALARGPHGPPATYYAKLGQVLRAQGRPEEAAEAFRQAVTGDPIQGWSGLAAARLDQGRFADARSATDHAIPLLEGSLRIDGRPARAVLNWLWLALAYEKQAKAAEARRWLNKAVNWLDQQGGQMPLDVNSMGAHPHNWLEAHVLRQEAEARLR